MERNKTSHWHSKAIFAFLLQATTTSLIFELYYPPESTALVILARMHWSISAVTAVQLKEILFTHRRDMRLISDMFGNLANMESTADRGRAGPGQVLFSGQDLEVLKYGIRSQKAMLLHRFVDYGAYQYLIIIKSST